MLELTMTLALRIPRPLINAGFRKMESNTPNSKTPIDKRLGLKTIRDPNNGDTDCNKSNGIV